MSRPARTAGALGHLLLVVTLAISIFVMHTLGHPDAPSAGTSTAPHTPAVTMADDPPVHDATDSQSAARNAHRVTKDAQSSSTDVPMPPMDMLSLCLAVLLGAWVLTALLRTALARRPDWLTRLLAQAPVLLRPDPPPRAPGLTQLSVLRQ